MKSIDQIRKEADELMGQVWSEARGGAGRMGCAAEARLVDLVLGELKARDLEIERLEHDLSECDGTIAGLRDELAQLSVDTESDIRDED